MIKSICIEMIFTEVPFYDRFKLASDNGFTHVEFWGWEDKDLDLIGKLCKKYDVKIASFSGDKDFSLVDKAELIDYVDYVEKSIEAAKKLDCDTLVIHSNALGEGGVVVNHYTELSDRSKYANMVNSLLKLAPIAEAAGVTLVLEALNIVVDHVGNFLAYTKDSADLIRLVDSKNIKILYDVYHMQINEGNIIDTLNENIDTIGYIHVADVPGRHEPGTGEINYPKVFEALRNLGYKGVIGFELDPIESSDRAIESIKSL